MKLIALISLAALALVGCAAVPGTSPDASTPSLPTGGSPPTDPTIPPDLTALPTISIPPDLGGVPIDLYVQAVDEAAAAAGVAASEVALERAAAVTWSDGSLNCPEPDQMYTQALVPGFWLVLRVGEQQFDFRASEQGQLTLCPSGQGQPPIEDR